MTLTSTQWLAIAAALAVVAIIVIALLAARTTRMRHAALRHKFGPEYDRALEEHGNIARAERELIARENRVHKLELRTLRETDRVRFSADWADVQAHFVDDPSGAVKRADELITAVMRARGYPIEDFEQRVADLSVEHSEVVQHYRAARVLAAQNREGRANTEELRQAFVHYRALFAGLLDQARTLDPKLAEVHP